MRGPGRGPRQVPGGCAVTIALGCAIPSPASGESPAGPEPGRTPDPRPCVPTAHPLRFLCRGRVLRDFPEPPKRRWAFASASHHPSPAWGCPTRPSPVPGHLRPAGSPLRALWKPKAGEGTTPGPGLGPGSPRSHALVRERSSSSPLSEWSPRWTEDLKGTRSGPQWDPREGRWPGCL